ncbi:MAG: helix-turn-helix domain-containing protein [Thermomicrobiales bacterium]
MVSRLNVQPKLAIAPEQLNPRAASPRPRYAPVRLVIGIVAAYPSLRAGLATLIQDDRDLTATAISPQMLGSSTRAASGNQISDADVLLIDSHDLDREALANMVVVASGDDIPLIWLGRPTPDLVRAVAGRPGGIIAPNAESETLIAAIRASAAGLLVYDPAQVGDIIHSESSGGGSAHPTRTPSSINDGFLSPREREVLALVASGFPNKAIARELGISDHTVKFHVSSLLTKLGAASRTEAVTLATRMGVLSL